MPEAKRTFPSNQAEPSSKAPATAPRRLTPRELVSADGEPLCHRVKVVVLLDFRRAEAPGEPLQQKRDLGGAAGAADEIDSLGLEHQANLLRVIETGEFEPVGSNETQICKARIIAATNWNLADAVERGTFRRDLYYRLHVISFHLPPLRHRPEDIGPLVRGMVARYGTKYGKRLFGVCPEALRVLEAFSWPGNIRQLENVVQQAVLTGTGNELKIHHLSPQVLARAESPASATPLPGGFDGTLKQTREATERANILRALEKANQSRTRAAQMLGVSRVTLYKKMKAYKLLKAKLPGTTFVSIGRKLTFVLSMMSGSCLVT